MAATVDAVTTATNSGTGSASFSWSHTIAPTAKRIDIVVGGGRASVSNGANGVKRIFVNGQAATRIATDPATFDITTGLELYRLLNPQTGPVTILAERDAAAYAPVACAAISFLGANLTTPGSDPVRVEATSPGASPFTVTRTVDVTPDSLTVTALLASAAFDAVTTASGAQTERANLQDADTKFLVVGTRSGDPPNLDHRYDLDADAGGRAYITLSWSVQAALPVPWIGETWLGRRWAGRWFGAQASADVTIPITGLEATAELGSPTPTPILTPLGVEATSEESDLIRFEGGGSWLGEGWFGRSWFGYRWFGPPAPPDDGPTNLHPDGLEAAGELGTPVVSVSPTFTGLEAVAEQDAVVRGIDYDIVPDGEEATGELGTLGNARTSAPAGLEATGELGTATAANVGQTNVVAGIEAIAEMGTAQAQPSLSVGGMEAIGELGTLGQDVTLPIVGLEAVGELGVPVSQVDEVETVAVTGEEATGELGTLTGNIDLLITGLEALGEIGTFEPISAFTPPSLEGLGEMGILGVDSGGVVTLPIATGLEVEAEEGTVTPVTVLTVTGEEATGEMGMDRIPVYSIVRMTNVSVAASELTSVSLGTSTMTNVEVIW